MDFRMIKGIVPPIVTPVDENERIDEVRFRKQIDFLIEHEVDGILLFGSNGEFCSLEDSEFERGMKIAVNQVAKRTILYFGIGAVSTRKCIKLAKMAVSNGADAISVLQPMFLKPTDDELYRHFLSIADSVAPVPMLLYNNPGRVGYTLSKHLVSRLAHEVSNIIGLKDSSGDISQLEEFVRLTRDVDFRVFGGKDTLIYAALAHGAVGVVTSTSNYVPALVKLIYDKFTSGDYKGALECQFLLNPIRILTDCTSFPVGTKDVANMIGLDVGVPCLPNKLTSDEEILNEMRKEISKLKELGFI